MHRQSDLFGCYGILLSVLERKRRSSSSFLNTDTATTNERLFTVDIFDTYSRLLIYRILSAFVSIMSGQAPNQRWLADGVCSIRIGSDRLEKQARDGQT
jgi:hypothetical protein